MIVKGIVNLNVLRRYRWDQRSKNCTVIFFLERIDQSAKYNLCLLVI